MTENREAIKAALAAFADGGLRARATALVESLGYKSERVGGDYDSPDDFIEAFGGDADTKGARALRDKGREICLVSQITDDEIIESLPLDERRFDSERAQSFLFAAIELRPREYPRGELATMTREINKHFTMPVVVIFRCGQAATLAYAARRPSMRDSERDVLRRVSLLRGIDLQNPHRAHLDILGELSLPARLLWMDAREINPDFEGLLAAWTACLDTEELNKRFYADLSAWFARACQQAKFPLARESKIERHLIRLITRILFVWFIRQKRLVADEFFVEEKARELLAAYREDGDDYYRAVLQNLFFATLNTEQGRRGFSAKERENHRVFHLYRYADLLADNDRFLALAQKSPFINGGLFDCLDSEEASGAGGYRVDCFTDNENHRRALSVPNLLFFGKETGAEGLFTILDRYKFTVEENTPIEQEVALDPELLGKVFENLLAANTPETQESARRLSGSYYTPRDVVDYMVDESLTAYLQPKMGPANPNECADRLRDLFDYEIEGCSFSEEETEKLMKAIAEIRVLDPAVGSGAFPMGVLHKLSLALQKLDPENRRWRELQRTRAESASASAFHDIADGGERENRLLEINHIFENYSTDFGRKLCLIQNSIFGADIQPPACQIAKLRFFISLAIEQTPDPAKKNLGIKPLPNLETRFVAADTLIPLTESQLDLTGKRVEGLEAQLKENRERHFRAATRETKLKCKKRDKELREKLAKVLAAECGLDQASARRIAKFDIYDQNTRSDWFDAEQMFGVADGFDIVIGNPPYVRHENIGAQKKARLLDLYQSGATGKSDLFIYFYLRGLSLAKQGGHLCYISSNKLMRVGYGKKTRQFLMQNAALKIAIDFGELPVFEAGVDPMILLAKKSNRRQREIVAAIVKDGADIARIRETVAEKGFPVRLSDLSAECWTFAPPRVHRLLQKMKSAGIPLRLYVDGRIHYGIKTGLNRAFVIDGETRGRLIEEDSNSAELIKPWLDGRDIKKWRANGERVKSYVLLVQQDTDIRSYPAILRHLSQFKEALLARSTPGAEKWFALQAPIPYHESFDEEKIVYNETSKELHAFIDRERLYINKTGFIILSPDNEYLLGIMNSKLMDFYFRHTFPAWGDPWRGGRVQFRGGLMSKIPIFWPEERKAEIVRLVRKIGENPQNREVADWESQIDQIVYALYGLTPEEIAQIESGNG